MSMSFEETLEKLYAANIYGIRPGLERIQELLRRLGNPQNAYPVIHIAGTNGKGSCSSFCAHVAAVMDKKTGWYTSPFLERFNERMRILDGREGLLRFEKNNRDADIPDADFVQLMEEILLQIDAMLDSGFEHPTVFEIETAAALLWFQRSKVDIAVLEVGLGGRLDSTNVVDQPLVCLITALGYDHMDRLGSRLADIAFEKAGIIKKGVPVYLYDPHDGVDDPTEADSALAVVRDKAASLNAPFHLVSKKEIREKERLPEGQKFTIAGEEEAYTIRLNGEYQLENALLCIRACQCFADEASIREGLARAIWPGRLEMMDQNPPLLIDGAHNNQGCASLRHELSQRFKGESILFLCGMLEDKQHQEMLELVLDSEDYQAISVICTRPPVPRGMSSRTLAEEAAKALTGEDGKLPLSPISDEKIKEINPDEPGVCQIFYDDDYKKAVAFAFRLRAITASPMVVFGSLYLVGNARPLIRETLAEARGEKTQEHSEL